MLVINPIYNEVSINKLCDIFYEIIIVKKCIEIFTLFYSVNILSHVTYS